MKYHHLYKPFLLLVLFVMLVGIACSSSTPVVKTPGGPATDNTESSPANEEAKPTKAPAVGSARSNPAPVGSEITADDMTFKVVEIVRPADKKVKDANTFNSEADTGMEYMLVKVSIVCTKGSDEKCSWMNYSMKLLGTDGKVQDPAMVAGLDGELENKEFFGGSNLSGYIPYQVSKDDKSPLIMYDPIFGDSFYLSLSASE